MARECDRVARVDQKSHHAGNMRSILKFAFGKTGLGHPFGCDLVATTRALLFKLVVGPGHHDATAAKVASQIHPTFTEATAEPSAHAQASKTLVGHSDLNHMKKLEQEVSAWPNILVHPAASEGRKFLLGCAPRGGPRRRAPLAPPPEARSLLAFVANKT